MKLNEMEKRMLYQTDGSERYAILHELLMESRYKRRWETGKSCALPERLLMQWDM